MHLIPDNTPVLLLSRTMPVAALVKLAVAPVKIVVDVVNKVEEIARPYNVLRNLSKREIHLNRLN